MFLNITRLIGKPVCVALYAAFEMMELTECTVYIVY